MRCFRVFSLLAVFLFAANSAIAQTTAPSTAKETSGVQQLAAATGPIVVKWELKKLKGEANLVVNPDGSYVFSGEVKDKKKNKDLVIVVALKSSLGAVIVFHFEGDTTHGVTWSHQGQSKILKDDFKTFSGKISWVGEWRLPLDKEGMAKLYEARQKKKEELKKEEEEAREKKDKKLAAERKKEREKLQQKEIAEAQAAAAQQQSGGSSALAEFTSVAQTVGSVVNTISSVGNAIADLIGG
jgi:hypothetical protein